VRRLGGWFGHWEQVDFSKILTCCRPNPESRVLAQYQPTHKEEHHAQERHRSCSRARIQRRRIRAGAGRQVGDPGHESNAGDPGRAQGRRADQGDPGDAGYARHARRSGRAQENDESPRRQKPRQTAKAEARAKAKAEAKAKADAKAEARAKAKAEAKAKADAKKAEAKARPTPRKPRQRNKHAAFSGEEKPGFGRAFLMRAPGGACGSPKNESNQLNGNGYLILSSESRVARY